MVKRIRAFASLTLILAVLAFPQGVSTDPQAIFDAAYWASKSPAINKGRDLDLTGYTSSPRWQYYSQLSAKGEVIDVPIMVWDWDPFNVMVLRQSFGQVYVPAGNGTPIKVSTNPSDYPPYGK